MVAGSRQMLQGCVDVGGKKIISKGKTHGLVGGIAGFHGGNDVGGVGWSAKQAEPLLAQTSGIAVLSEKGK